MKSVSLVALGLGLCLSSTSFAARENCQRLPIQGLWKNGNGVKFRIMVDPSCEKVIKSFLLNQSLEEVSFM